MLLRRYSTQLEHIRMCKSTKGIAGSKLRLTLCQSACKNALDVWAIHIMYVIITMVVAHVIARNILLWCS